VRQAAAYSSSYAIASAASCPAPLGRLDLKAGIAQPIDNEIGGLVGIKDLMVKVGAAEQVDEHVLGS
jgi:hypothetical protein